MRKEGCQLPAFLLSIKQKLSQTPLNGLLLRLLPKRGVMVTEALSCQSRWETGRFMGVTDGCRASQPTGSAMDGTGMELCLQDFGITEVMAL